MSNAIQRSEARVGDIVRGDDFGRKILDGLPAWIDRDQFSTAAIVALSDPDISNKTSIRSQIEAVAACAQMGLMPGADKHVYLFPRGNKLCADPSARGFRFLAERQAGIRSVEPRLVRVDDTFQAAPHPTIPGEYVVTKHEDGGGFFGSRDIRFDPDPNKAGCLGGYVHIIYEDGTERFHRVPWSAIMKAAKSSRSSKFWGEWTAEMATKTLLRDAWSRGALRGTAGDGAFLARAAKAHDDFHGRDEKRATESKANALLAAPRETVEAEVEDDFLPDDEPATDHSNATIDELVALVAGKWNEDFDAVLERCLPEIGSKATTLGKLSDGEVENARAWCIAELEVSNG